MEQSRPTSRSAARLSASAAPSALASASAHAAVATARLPSGHTITRLSASKRSPSAVSGEPIMTLCGAATRPRRRSASTTSCACTKTRDVRAGGVQPAANICAVPTSTPATDAGGTTGSSAAQPVARRRLRLALRQLASRLHRASISRPPLRAPGRRLLLVELGLHMLCVSRDERGYTLEAVRGERAPEPHPPVDAKSRLAAGVPPNEALLPQVGTLDRAERVRGFGVDAVAADAYSTALALRLAPDRALDVGDAGVHGVGAAITAVRGDAGFHIVLEDAIVAHPRARLQHDAAWLQSARHKGQVARRRRHPLLLLVRRDCRLSRRHLRQQALVVECEHRQLLDVRPRLDAALAYLTDDVGVVPAELARDTPHRRTIELSLAREDRVACRPPNRPAVARVRAVPDGASRERGHPVLPDDARGHLRWRLAAPNRGRGRVGQPQPALHLVLIHAGQVQLLDAHRPLRQTRRRRRRRTVCRALGTRAPRPLHRRRPAHRRRTVGRVAVAALVIATLGVPRRPPPAEPPPFQQPCAPA
eukprot:7145121-Prymnesium_polylepis.2